MTQFGASTIAQQIVVYRPQEQIRIGWTEAASYGSMALVTKRIWSFQPDVLTFVEDISV